MARKSNSKSVQAAEAELAVVVTPVEPEETNWVLPANRIEAAPEVDLEVVEKPMEEPEVVEIEDSQSASSLAEVVQKHWPSIGKYAEHLIKTDPNLKNSQIVALVKQAFPNANTSTSCIAWYRSNLKKPIVRSKKARAVWPTVGQVCVVDDFGNQL